MKLKKYLDKDKEIPLRKPKGVSANQWSRAIELYEAAKKVGDKFPELTVAQAALETGWFRKESGKNNFFGQKATKSQKGSQVSTKEVYNGQQVSIKDKFRDYDTIEESLLDRKKKWMSKYENANNPEEAINSIWKLNKEKQQGEGYATDPEYGGKIFSILGMMGVDKSTQKPIPTKKEDYKKDIEYPTQKVDNTVIVKTPKLKVPQYSNTPYINNTTKQQEQKTTAKESITEEQIRSILEQEKQATEQKFIEAYSRNSVPQEPQAQEISQPFRNLYQYVNPEVESYLEEGGEYEVIKGDSLSKIAKQKGITLKNLLDLNPKYKENPGIVNIGDKLVISARNNEEELNYHTLSNRLDKDVDTDYPLRKIESLRTKNTNLRFLKPVGNEKEFENLTSKDEIKRAQTILYYSGYDIGKSKKAAIDGKLGKKTKQAIIDYNNNKKLKNKQLEKNVYDNVKNVIPLSVRQFVYDSFGGEASVNEKDLDYSTIESLKKVVTNNLRKGKLKLDYNDWREARGSDVDTRNDDMNLLDPFSNLQKTLGQARIKVDKLGDVYVEDTYNFNDAGKNKKYKNSFTDEEGLLPLDDATSISNGIYRIARNYKTKYGRSEGGSPVKIYIGNVSDVF